MPWAKDPARSTPALSVERDTERDDQGVVSTMGDEREPATITVPIVLPLHQHTRAWQVVAATLAIMLVAAIVIAGYLWNVNGKWQAQVSALTDTGYTLGDRIAEHQA